MPHDILFHQTAGRYVDSWTHYQPPWYYLGVILGGWLPLWLTWFGVVPRWWHDLRTRDARILLPLAWAVLVIVFFSFPAGKRDMYILPALPMVALCSGPYLAEIVVQRWFRALALGLIVALGAAFVAGGLYAWSGHLKAAQDFVVERGLANDGAALWGFVVVVGAAALASALVFGLRRGAHALAAGLAALWLLWSFWACPVLNDSSSAHGVMRRAGEIAGSDAQIGLVAWKEQNLLLADRRITEFGFVKPWHEQLAEAIRWQESMPEQRWIFILADAMAPCVDRAKAQYVGHANRREWWLFRADAVASDCVGGKVPAPSDADAGDPNSD